MPNKPTTKMPPTIFPIVASLFFMLIALSMTIFPQVDTKPKITPITAKIIDVYIGKSGAWETATRIEDGRVMTWYGKLGAPGETINIFVKDDGSFQLSP